VKEMTDNLGKNFTFERK